MIQEAGILVGEAVVVLLPDMGGEKIIQRRDVTAPRQLRGDLEPFGVLVEHRVDDVDERLVAIEQPVPAGQQITFQPSLALVFAEHRIEHSPCGSEEFVVLDGAGLPLPVGDLKDRAEHVGQGFVGSEDPEVALLVVERDDIAQEGAEHAGVLCLHRAGRGHRNRVGAEVGHPQVTQQHPAVGVRVGAHPPLPPRGQRGQVGQQPPGLIEQLLGFVAAHPGFRAARRARDAARRRAVAPGVPGTSPRSVGRRRLWVRSSLWRAQHDHRPPRAGGVAGGSSVALDGVNGLDRLVEDGGHQFVHVFGVVAFDVARFPAAAAQELVEFLVFDAGQHRRVADLVAVEMQDRQHRPVADGIEELGGMPGRGQRTGLGLTVADDAGHDQVRIVEHGAERVAQRVAQFPAFVDRSRSRRRHMAGNASGKGELGEQLLHARPRPG